MYGSRAFSFVGGQSLGGLLVQLLSAPGALLADAVSFLVSALFLGRISAAEPPPAEADPRGDVRAGARWILRSPLIRASLWAGATLNFFNFVFSALFILYVTRTLHVPPATLGVVLGSGAVGAVVGTLVAGRLTRRLGIGPTLILGSVLFPAPFLLVPLAGGPRPLLLALLFGAEFGVGLWIAAAGGLLGVVWLLRSPFPRLKTLPDPPG